MCNKLHPEDTPFFIKVDMNNNGEFVFCKVIRVDDGYQTLATESKPEFISEDKVQPLYKVAYNVHV